MTGPASLWASQPYGGEQLPQKPVSLPGKERADVVHRLLVGYQKVGYF